MVTRRPTLIQLKKADDTADTATITVQLGRKKGSIHDLDFDEIVNTIRNESCSKDRIAFKGELIIDITAPGLPNITFTDLPGLITDNRSLGDCDYSYHSSATQGGQPSTMSIRQLVESYMVRKNTTLVVVEPASVEDFETSQVSPLLR